MKACILVSLIFFLKPIGANIAYVREEHFRVTCALEFGGLKDECSLGFYLVGSFVECATHCTRDDECTSVHVYEKAESMICTLYAVKFDSEECLSTEENCNQRLMLKMSLENQRNDIGLIQNVAFKKKAFQSSTYANLAVPENAVDDINDNFWDCASTDFESLPYWYVDLDSYYEIQRVEILNRADCCPERLHDVDVTVSGCNKDFHMLCGTFEGPGTLAEIVVLECPNGTIGRYVKLQITKGIDNILSICDVKVIGK